MTNTFKVFVTRPIPEAGLSLLKEKKEDGLNLQIEIWPGPLPPTKDVLLQKVKGIHGLLCLLTDPIDKEVLDAAGPQLKVVSQMAVGFNNIDVKACSERRIPVGNTPGVLTEATADLAVALLLASSRNLCAAAESVKRGEWKTWEPMGFLGPGVYNCTIGIVGMGRIGYAVAQRLKGFQVKLLYSDNYGHAQVESELGAKRVSLETLLSESDIVTVHCPLMPETHRLINSERLKLMKRTAGLINTARGEIVDTEALYAALKDGSIAFAGLDTTDPEPLPPDHPLLQLPNVTVLPHIGSASHKTRGDMATMAANNLRAGLMGLPLPYCANPEIYS